MISGSQLSEMLTISYCCVLLSFRSCNCLLSIEPNWGVHFLTSQKASVEEGPYRCRCKVGHAEESNEAKLSTFIRWLVITIENLMWGQVLGFWFLLKSPSLLFAVAKLGELSVQRKALRPVDCRPASWLPSEKASTSFDPNSSGFDVRWVTCDLCRKFASWCVDCLSRSFQNL